MFKQIKNFMLILLSLFIYLIVFSLFGFYTSIKPSKIISKKTPKDFNLPYEEVSFSTKDNINIYGWFIPSQKKDNPKTIIFLHGYPADQGNILPSIAFLNKNYNLFLFDFRYLGKSGGNYSTAGAKETLDLKAAIKFLKSKNINKVGVWGFSMGGAVALMTASETPEIAVIVSESSYANLHKMSYALYRLPVLKYPLGWLTSFWAKIFLGINASEISPQESAKKINIPVLIIHSKSDQTIPFSNALLLKKALEKNSLAEFWFTNNLTHGEAIKEYNKRLESFFDNNL